jgi:hypothetical protein
VGERRTWVSEGTPERRRGDAQSPVDGPAPGEQVGRRWPGHRHLGRKPEGGENLPGCDGACTVAVVQPPLLAEGGEPVAVATFVDRAATHHKMYADRADGLKSLAEEGAAALTP